MARPERVFLTIAATAAFVSALVFTIAPLYRFQTAGLDNLQLVLVGSVMEAAVFVFEIPTGIVADRWSRKWSVVIGHAGMGVGFLVEAASPTFAGILVGQALWGLAYTFTSGATVAWIAGELDDPSRQVLTRLFLRSSRRGSLAALVAVPASYALGIHLSLRVPIVIGGVVSIGLAVWLAVAMVERHFEPVPSAARSSWRAMGESAAAGLRAIRASHALTFLALAIFLAGGASEAYDRYIEKYLLGLGTPARPVWSNVTWLAVVGCVSAALGIVVPWWFERRHGNLGGTQQRHWIVGLIGVQVVGLLALAVDRVVRGRRGDEPRDRSRQVAAQQPDGRVDRPAHAARATGDGAVDARAGRLDQPGDDRPRDGGHRTPRRDPGRLRRQCRAARAVRAGRAGGPRSRSARGVATREDRWVIVDEELVRRIEASAARVTTATVAAYIGHSNNAPARGAPFGAGALAAFGPGRYVNRAVGVSLDDIDDGGLDELEKFYAASGVAPSLEVASWAPPVLIKRLAARGYVTEWFRNVYACVLEDLTIRTHPTMMVREVDAGSLDEWLAVIRAGHSFTSTQTIEVSDEYARAAHALPGATDYLAEIEGNPAGCGSLVRDEGIGWLGGATTIGRFRERGVQGALVRERMVAAQAGGCDLAVATAIPAGASSRNLSRLGFTLAYCQAVMTKMDG